MKKLLLSLGVLFLFASLQTSYANDILIPFGQNLNSPLSEWKYRGGGVDLHASAWKTYGYTETNWQTGRSALGFGSSNPSKTTSIPENTSAGGGGATNARYSTMYFRKKINIPAGSDYTGYRIRTQFDDGIVIWVNGTEVYRNNVGTGTVNYNTWAAGAIANNGSDIFTIPAAAGFVTGDNIISVEVHQVNATSTDLFFDLELTGLDGSATVTRGPYLQMGGQTSITLRWQTDAATNSRVSLGSSFGNYTTVIDDAAVTTNHIVNITGLTPDTKYFYSLGSSSSTQLAAANTFFVTLPGNSSTRKLRFAAFGDCGNNSSNQQDTKNALLNYLGTNNLDGLLTIGDNAYSSGLDNEFQNGFFNVYQNDILRNTKLYTTTGNHDYGNSSANTGVRNNAYYTNFTIPTAGELGGVASGTEAYYSYNIGDVHFIALDSYGRENSNTTKMYDTTGAQCVWLKNDLATNNKKWTVVYFHHPPYTKTSHDSDGEADLQAIRERFIRILERYGVDLVVCGHAHGYERSYLLKNYYTTNGALPGLLDNAFNKVLHTADSSSARYDGSALSCPYKYNSGKYNHGSVYIVAGSAGQVGGSASGYPLNSTFYSNNTNGGSLYFEVDSNRLDAKFIGYNVAGASGVPVIRDQFTIFKDINKVTNIVIGQNSPLTLAASWKGSYYWPGNGGAATQAVQPSTAAVGTFTYIVRDAASNGCLKDSFHVIVTSPTPVLVTEFSATLQKDKVLLEWATEQELNNQLFTIEKSADAVAYTKFADVSGAGTSNVRKTYHLTDHQPFEGVNYYRLSQTDINGTKKNIGVKRVTYNNGKDFSATVINAGKGKVNILVNSRIAGNISIKIVDMLGKEILTQTLSVPVGAYTKSVQLGKGVYAVQISNSNQRISQKIVIE